MPEEIEIRMVANSFPLPFGLLLPFPRPSFNPPFKLVSTHGGPNMLAPTPQEMASWPAPNYINPHTLVPAVYGVTITFTVLMLPFIFARIRMRLRVKGSLGIDDYIILGAAVRYHSKINSIFLLTCRARFSAWDP
jgi:hypothetical protein